MFSNKMWNKRIPYAKNEKPLRKTRYFVFPQNLFHKQPQKMKVCLLVVAVKTLLLTIFFTIYQENSLQILCSSIHFQLSIFLSQPLANSSVTVDCLGRSRFSSSYPSTIHLLFCPSIHQNYTFRIVDWIPPHYHTTPRNERAKDPIPFYFSFNSKLFICGLKFVILLTLEKGC